jgi:hypothetical protein
VPELLAGFASKMLTSELTLWALCTGSSTAHLLQALEDYLPVLLGLVKEGGGLRHSVQFVWTNQEDNAEVKLSSIIYACQLHYD